MKRAWVVGLTLMTSLSVSAEVVDRTVAIVGKEVILKSDVYELLAHPTSAGKTAEDALSFLIDKAVLQEDCKQNGNYPSDAEIKQAVVEVQKQNHLPDEAALIAALQRNGTSFTAYKAQLGVELCKSRIVHGKIRPRVNISDDDVKLAFEQQNKGKNVKLRLRDMQISAARNSAAVPKAKKLAEEIYNQLNKGGESWEDVLAKAKKSGLKVASEELGVLARSDLDPSVSDIVFTEAAGNYRGPVQTDEGFHVLEVQERVQGQETPLAQVQNDLHKQLFEKEVERLLKQYVDEAKSSVYIDVLGMNER